MKEKYMNNLKQQEMKNAQNQRMQNQRIQNKRIQNQQGVTLLEVLLYIGLFSILCISLIFLYISVSKTAESMKANIQRTEIAFFVYEIARHKLDNQPNSQPNVQTLINVSDFSRIMKFYPNFRMTEATISNNPFRVTYTISQKGVHALSEKIFSNTIYIEAL